MGARLFYRFGSSNGVFPALPLDSSIYVTPIGRPEHTNVQRHSRHIIKDEGEGVLVTGEIEAIASLPCNQEQNSQEKEKWKLQSQRDDDQRNPGEVRLHLAENRPGCAAHQAIEILLPALPHGLKGAVHAHADDPLAGAE